VFVAFSETKLKKKFSNSQVVTFVERRIGRRTTVPGL